MKLRNIFIAVIMLFALFVTAQPTSVDILKESKGQVIADLQHKLNAKTIILLDSLGVEMIKMVLDPQTYELAKRTVTQFFETKGSTLIPVHTSVNSVTMQTITRQESPTFWQEAKTALDNFVYRIENADGLWAKTGEFLEWTKQSAIEIYQIFRWQYQAKGFILFSKFIGMLLLTLIISWVLSVRYIFKRKDGLASEDVIFQRITSIFVIIVLAITTTTTFTMDIIMLFNPDYYIMKDLFNLL